MSTTDSTKIRSNRNPILADFRYDSEVRNASSRVEWAAYWAKKLTAETSPSGIWTQGASVSQQVFAARVLHRYAGVFA